MGVYWSYTGIMEKKMETSIVYWISSILRLRIIGPGLPFVMKE